MSLVIRYLLEGMKSIEKAKEDTLNAMEGISAVSEETASSATELSATASEQLKAVEALNQAVVVLNEDSKRLENTVSVFKL
jgi:methyl-accepting chemotaxis protein